MTNYTIKQNTHHSRIIPGIWNVQKEFIWNIKLNTRYIIPDQSQWNTAAGISINGLTTKNSIRFGWRYSPDRLGFDLCVYTMVEGKLSTDHLYPFSVRTGVEIKFMINYNNMTGDYVITIKGGHYKKYVCHTNRIAAPFWGRFYYPTFGKSYTAPTDISVYQQKIL